LTVFYNDFILFALFLFMIETIHIHIQ